MRVQNARNVNPLEGKYGEVVYELLGAAAGGSRAHSLAQIVIPAGKASLKHYHPIAEESYYILSGTARMELDDEIAMLGPGDNVVILPNQVHQITNAGPGDVTLLAVCVPAWTPDNSVFLDHSRPA
ncbi:MAG TPA: cupin domain-containing protein [Aggregatilineaceae bacterium]|jgi:mannose-6-phosphate isomerase-like protein (cupin superfamily)|nr:cupin domain-containing protein [Aggregatilineaceae bacterium]